MFEKRRRNKPSISYKVDSIKKDQNFINDSFFVLFVLLPAYLILYAR